MPKRDDKNTTSHIRRAFRPVSWDDLSDPFTRRMFYLLAVLIVVGMAILGWQHVVAFIEQKRNAANIRQLAQTHLTTVEIYAGGRQDLAVHCATVDDGSALEFIRDTLSSAEASIEPEMTPVLYEFTLVTTDVDGRRVNLQGIVAERYPEDVFIDFMYTGPLFEWEPHIWQFPVMLKGRGPWIAGTFKTHNCPSLRPKRDLLRNPGTAF